MIRIRKPAFQSSVRQFEKQCGLTLVPKHGFLSATFDDGRQTFPG